MPPTLVGESNHASTPLGIPTDSLFWENALADENGRLKKLVAELSLDKAVLQDVLSKKFPGPRS